MGDPTSLYPKLNSSTVRGSEELGELTNAGLANIDDQSRLQPMLAEAVPSAENGLWKLLPDGRMETTWTLRSGAQWHDGQPITADDLVFTAQVQQDPELQLFRDPAYDLVESVQTIDPRTILVRWKRPYIDADQMFTKQIALPLPKHLLERPYTDAKATFLELPFWSTDFVGSGPFKLKEFARSSHVTLVAHEQFAPGRPKLAEIDVRFITDSNTVIANLLSGTIDLMLGRGISVEEGQQVRDRWTSGQIEYKALETWVVIYPQFVNPTPAVVGNASFRRALMYAVDRQAMVDSIQSGLVPVAHSVVSPNNPYFKEVDRSIVRYDYDPRQSAQLLEGLGYAKGSDGIYQDGAGQRLGLEIRSTSSDLNQKSLLSVADFWRRAGLDVEPVIISPQRATDREYRASFPAFELQRQPANLRPLRNLHSSEARTGENRFAGSNNARYINSAMDELVNRYLVAIPIADRIQAVSGIIHQVTDQLVWMGLFFDTEPALVGNRLVNVGPRAEDSAQTWNAHEWDVH
ncbi:MAG: peptide/nickel transport system substrate-binding protein [Chloroflexota bacterium]|nr:peptide/nickel transport system substrate-binding protein [Chloroflexota bacterium]